MNLFDKVEKTNNPFIIKAAVPRNPFAQPPAKEESKEVEANPLSSEVALKKIKEDLDESPVKEFNILDVKGNSKVRTSAEAFKPVKMELPTSGVNLFKSAVLPAFKPSSAKNLVFNFKKAESEEQKSESPTELKSEAPTKIDLGVKTEIPAKEEESPEPEEKVESPTKVEQASGKIF